MQQIPRHTEYRASGLAWVGDIPSHWQTRRNRFLFREVDSRSVHGQETHLSMSQVHGLVPSQALGRKSLQSESYAGGKLVAENDLVLNRLKAHLGVFARAKQTGVISPDYSVFRSKSDVSVPYCELLFKTPFYVAEFRRRTKGIVEGFWRLYTDDFYDVSALTPPRAEQDQIVAYLRVQDAHIARFIKAKRELIKLLTEQKLRIIDRAVTRGLDASVALKPSGIEWLGEVPEHWDVSRLGACIKTNRTGVWGSDPSDRNQPDQLICVRVADFDMEQLAVGISKLTVRAVTQSERSGRLLCSGDILLEKSGGGDKTPVGRVIAFTLDKVSVCSNFVARLVPNTNIVHSAFLLTVMNHLHARRIVVPYIKQTTGIQNLDSTAYFKLGVALPSLDEQVIILRALTEQCQPLNDAIQRAEEEIKLIREYRDRLIADVVTGQVDVRGWVPGPDEVVAEENLAVLAGDESIDADEEEDDGQED